MGEGYKNNVIIYLQVQKSSTTKQRKAIKLNDVTRTTGHRNVGNRIHGVEDLGQ